MLLEKPPPLRLSEWADQHFYLSAESSGTEGAWLTLPYQRAVMDLIGGDYVETVTWQKSARVGYTKILVAAADYFVSYKRRSGAIWQPTDSDAAEFKKDEVNPSFRDVPVVRAAMLADPEVKSKHNTEDRVGFHGATMYIRGGKSGRNYRRLTLDWAFYDELSAFDADIDGEGSATSLGDVRLAASPHRKSVRGSTPKVQGDDQIERSMAEAGIQIFRELPCPHCGEFHRLEWHHFHYDRADPEGTAAFACPRCGGMYSYASYVDMDAGGRWAAQDGRWIDEDAELLRSADGAVVPWPSHVGVFIWAAYSYIQSWSRLARQWVDANAEKQRSGDFAKLKAFINTQLAETWKEHAAALDADALMARREPYAAEVPAGALVLLMGVDTQDDRLEVEVFGLGPDNETWGVLHKVLHGDPADGDVWDQLDQERGRIYRHESGSPMRVVACGIDSGGHRTQHVYEYCRTRHHEKVYCLRGVGGEGVPVTKKPSDVKMRTGATVKLYSVGVDALKARFMSLLQRTTDQLGYQHIPLHYSNEWCEQAVSEWYVERHERGRVTKQWIKLRARNEALDMRVYGMAAAEILNITWESARKLLESGKAVVPAPAKPRAETEAGKPRPRRRVINRGVTL